MPVATFPMAALPQLGSTSSETKRPQDLRIMTAIGDARASIEHGCLHFRLGYAENRHESNLHLEYEECDAVRRRKPTRQRCRLDGENAFHNEMSLVPKRMLSATRPLRPTPRSQ